MSELSIPDALTERPSTCGSPHSGTLNVENSSSSLTVMRKFDRWQPDVSVVVTADGAALRVEVIADGAL